MDRTEGHMEQGRFHTQDHNFYVRQELIQPILDRRKLIEVRLATIHFLRVKPNHTITFNKIPETKRTVEAVNNYESFRELLANENPDHILPGYDVGTIYQLLRSIYPGRSEQNGVLAFHLK